MKAQVLKNISPIENRPLELVEMPVPQPKLGEILVKISACGVCHTELDEIEGILQPKLPIILGHEIVGKVESLGPEVSRFRIGERVGIAWIHSACGKCDFCREGFFDINQVCIFKNCGIFMLPEYFWKNHL